MGRTCAAPARLGPCLGRQPGTEPVSAEDIAWPFEFVFPFELHVCFAKYSEES